MKGYKLFIFASLIFVGQISSAEIKQEVALSFAEYDGRYLSFGYAMGGGCQPHSAVVVVTFEKHPASTSEEYPAYIADVNVLDVTPEPDGCEALLYPSGVVDLNVEVEKAFVDIKSKNSNSYVRKIRLPSVSSPKKEGAPAIPEAVFINVDNELVIENLKSLSADLQSASDLVSIEQLNLQVSQIRMNLEEEAKVAHLNFMTSLKDLAASDLSKEPVLNEVPTYGGPVFAQQIVETAELWNQYPDGNTPTGNIEWMTDSLAKRLEKLVFATAVIEKKAQDFSKKATQYFAIVNGIQRIERVQNWSLNTFQEGLKAGSLNYSKDYGFNSMAWLTQEVTLLAQQIRTTVPSEVQTPILKSMIDQLEIMVPGFLKTLMNIKILNTVQSFRYVDDFKEEKVYNQRLVDMAFFRAQLIYPELEKMIGLSAESKQAMQSLKTQIDKMKLP